MAFAARASIEGGVLVLARGARRLELPVTDIAAIAPWRVPLPGPGVALRLASGERWHYGIALTNPTALARALAVAGGPPEPQDSHPSREAAYAKARLSIRRGRLDHPLTKFILFPLVLALPAFRLHQHIAYGGSFGEYYTFGLKAYLTTLSLWWAAWAIGVVLTAAALRAAIEGGTLLAVLLRPTQAVELRRWLERVALALLYLGLPAWLLLHVVGT
jgi:apolipoprotein N-acyltransferase